MVPRRTLLLSAFLLLGGGSLQRLSAGLIYLNDVPVGARVPVIDTTYAPVTAGDTSGFGGSQMFLSSEGYFLYNPATEALTPLSEYPPGVTQRLSTTSIVAVSGQQSSPTLHFYNLISQIVSVDITSDQATEAFVDSLLEVSSIAMGPNGLLTALADGQGYTIDPATGAAGLAFAQSGLNGDGAPGDFNNARYQAYGPNGLLYVLDYGNNRIQVLDPNNGYGVVQEIALNPLDPVANMQFAIDPNGTIFLGNGEGGGSYYDPAGDFLGTFTLPPGTYPALSSFSTPQVSTDALGHVYVLDSTGAHVFDEVPEPSTLLLCLWAGLAGLVVRRRQRGSANLAAVRLNVR